MSKKTSLQSRLEQIEKKIFNKDYNNALNLLESIYSDNSKDLHINLLMGEMHLSLGQYRESKKFFNKSMEIEKNHFQALYGLGKILYLQGNSKDGIQHILHAHKLQPERFDICRDLGDIYQNINDQINAEKYLVLACQLTDYNEESFFNLLEFYSENNKLKLANILLEKYYDDNSKNCLLIFRKGIIDIQNNNFQDSIKSFSKIIKIEPQNMNAIYHRGFSYLNINEVQKARRDFEQCLKISPNEDDIHAILALTYTLEGKVSHSIDVWKEFFPIFTKKAIANKFQNNIGKIQPMKIIDKIEKQENKIYDLSIVIPVNNEEGSLLILYEKLKNVLDELEKTYQIIFIDDGSEDNSLAILEDLSRQNRDVVTLKFRRNYGQTAAFAAGFKYASGDIIITMDADLQNDPIDIPHLLQKMSEGYDLVSGWRKNRKDKEFGRKLPSKIANKIINKLIYGTGIKIHDFGCSLKAYKKAIVKRIKLYGEMHRFIPAYAAWLGIKVAEIPVTHHSRKFGEAKYGLGRVWRVLLDLITLRFYTGFRTHPFLFFGKFALMTIFFGTLISIMLFFSHIFFEIGITGQTLMIFLIMTLFGGLQFIIVGLLSEIITRGFFEAKNQEEYIVEEIISMDSK